MPLFLSLEQITDDARPRCPPGRQFRRHRDTRRIVLNRRSESIRSTRHVLVAGGRGGSAPLPMPVPHRARSLSSARLFGRRSHWFSRFTARYRHRQSQTGALIAETRGGRRAHGASLGHVCYCASSLLRLFCHCTPRWSPYPAQAARGVVFESCWYHYHYGTNPAPVARTDDKRC